MKVEEKRVQQITNIGNNKLNNGGEKRFRDVLKSTTKSNDLISSSKSIKELQRLFKIDIGEHKDKYIKYNRKVNLENIIDEFGDNLGTQELNEFLKVINSLSKEGLLDEEDYIKALKWIQLKIKQNSTKINTELEKKDTALNLLKI